VGRALASAAVLAAARRESGAYPSCVSRKDPEDALGVGMRDALQVSSGERCRLQKRNGRRRRLVWVIDRPHDVVDADLIHAESEHEGILEAACSNREVRAQVLACLELVAKI